MTNAVLRVLIEVLVVISLISVILFYRGQSLKHQAEVIRYQASLQQCSEATILLQKKSELEIISRQKEADAQAAIYEKNKKQQEEIKSAGLTCEETFAWMINQAAVIYD